MKKRAATLGNLRTLMNYCSKEDLYHLKFKSTFGLAFFAQLVAMNFGTLLGLRPSDSVLVLIGILGGATGYFCARHICRRRSVSANEDQLRVSSIATIN